MARIVQVADTYDAMVSDRPYRKPLTHEEAARELRQHEGKQFDPRVIEAFLDTFEVISRRSQ
jgi:HD-GYP domain-containing protein (c-di-GMP phosphodiesterase class II)